MPLPIPNKKKVETVKELRVKKLSFRQIAKLMDSDVKTVYRWHKYSLDPNFVAYTPGQYLKQKAIQIKAQAKYRAKNKQKVRARKEVFKILRTGSFLKKPCEVCGAAESEAHHPNHKKPLHVVWLCRTHHREAEAAELSTAE